MVLILSYAGELRLNKRDVLPFALRKFSILIPLVEGNDARVTSARIQRAAKFSRRLLRRAEQQTKLVARFFVPLPRFIER